jgi:ribosomal-protein-alanine N-acetyltransferase
MFEFISGKPEDSIVVELWDKICVMTNNTRFLGDVQDWFKEDVGGEHAIIFRHNGRLAGVCSGVKHLHHYTPVIVFVFPEFLTDLDAGSFYEKLTGMWFSLPGVSRIMAEFESWIKIFGKCCPSYDLTGFGMNRHGRFLMEADLPGISTEKEPSPFLIEKLNKDHLPRVKEILSAQVEPGLEDIWHEDFITYNIEKCLADVVENENSVAIGAFFDNELTGFVFADPQGFIRYTAVSREMAGRGIGSALMKFALKDLAERGVPKSRLIVTDRNKPAIRLYEKCGFKEIGNYGVWTWQKNPQL